MAKESSEKRKDDNGKKKESQGERHKRLEKTYSHPSLQAAFRCPFCGGDILGIKQAEHNSFIPRDCWRVFCANCRSMGPVGLSEEAAVCRWNHGRSG